MQPPPSDDIRSTSALSRIDNGCYFGDTREDFGVPVGGYSPSPAAPQSGVLFAPWSRKLNQAFPPLGLMVIAFGAVVCVDHQRMQVDHPAHELPPITALEQ